MIPLRASVFPFLYVGDGGGQADIYISSSAGLRDYSRRKGTTGYRARDAYLVNACRRRLTNLVPGFVPSARSNV